MHSPSYIHNSTHMHITSVTRVDKLLLLFLVVVSAIINEALMLRVGINSGPKDQGPVDPKETLNPRIQILL